MRVLVISAAFPPQASGEATNAFHLSQNLKSRGLEVDVLTTAGGAPRDALPGVRVHPIMKGWGWSQVPRFKKFLKQTKPDVILLVYIGWIYQHEFMITFAPTIAKSVLPNVRFVTRFENAVGADPSKTSAMSRLIRKVAAATDRVGDVHYAYGTLLRDSDAAVVLSERHLEQLEKEYAPVVQRTVVIPPPPNMKLSSETDLAARGRSRAKLGLADDEFAIAFIGYLYAGKGLEALIRAFHLVAEERPRARLVMIGGSIAAESGNASDYAQTIQRLAQELGIADRVTWTGPYRSDTEEASLYLRAADLCVLPFINGVHMNCSSFSSAVSHGLPVVTTEGDYLDRPIRHGENVFLCQPQNHVAIASGIKAMMDDIGLRDRIRTGARRLAAEWFSWDSAMDRTLRTMG